ncbi:MAG: hypothetical protein LKE51_14225 [Selenomonas sp.]|nr:hypothetical protein [Selenomonas sp.]
MDANKYSCPNCGSGNTASIPLVYKRGHATGNATHREVVSYNVQTTTTTYGDGHKETEETGRTPVYGNVTRPTYTETDLAKEVAPPTPPDEPQLIQSGYDFVALGCGSIGCLFPFLMLVAYVILKYFIKTPMTQSAWDNVSYLIFATVVFLVVYNIYTTKKLNTRHKKEHAIAMEEYKKQMEEYYRSVEDWQHLYICNRCGCKFRVDD